jgi:hypothetical protein
MPVKRLDILRHLPLGVMPVRGLDTLKLYVTYSVLITAASPSIGSGHNACQGA